MCTPPPFPRESLACAASPCKHGMRQLYRTHQAVQDGLLQAHLLLQVIQVLLPGAEVVEADDLAAGVHLQPLLQRLLRGVNTVNNTCGE